MIIIYVHVYIVSCTGIYSLMKSLEISVQNALARPPVIFCKSSTGSYQNGVKYVHKILLIIIEIPIQGLIKGPFRSQICLRGPLKYIPTQ